MSYPGDETDPQESLEGTDLPSLGNQSDGRDVGSPMAEESRPEAAGNGPGDDTSILEGEPGGDDESGAPDEPEREGDGGDEPGRRKRSLPFWVEVPLLMALALVIAVVIKTFFIQAFFIPSGSMEDTLNIDDRILVNKLAYRFGEPERGDVVVFDSGEHRDESILESVRRNLAEAVGLAAPESDFIKRIVALPGEEIMIRNNQVYIDGVAIAEPYLRVGTDMRDFGPELVPPDHYFMMGDHRNLSSDSRVTGPVDFDRFVGRAFVIVWPPGNWSGL